MTHTIPLLFADADCWFAAFDRVRALVVLPELPVAGGVVGAPASALPEALLEEALEELDDCPALPLDSLVPPVEPLVRALVVLPEFDPAVGFVELPDVALAALPESVDVLFDFLLLVVPLLFSPADGESPVGGVAVCDGSAAAAFLVLLVATGVVFAFSPSAFPALSLLVLDLLREEVAEEPELLVELSAAPAASLESVFFLDFVFFEVLEVSPELAC